MKFLFVTNYYQTCELSENRVVLLVNIQLHNIEWI